jgi:uncharacterized membrane protein YraQ (UPF0718 family)
MSTETDAVRPHHSARLRVGLPALAAITITGLTWAKWWPYLLKLRGLATSHAWPGSSILRSAGAAGDAPSLHGGWEFTVTYGEAVWKALAVALVVAAAVDAVVPRRWPAGVLGRPGRFGGPAVAGLLAIPCMMCTCCAAPLARTLRRGGAPTSSVLAFWLGNPVLNPAVLAFLALVAPWQWFATRLVVGAFLVFGVSVLVGRLAGPVPEPDTPAAVEPDDDLRAVPRRFATTLLRLCATLVPEYAVVVFAVGTFRGWLFPLDGAGHWGVLAVVLAAVLGTLVVIPTAGEIPVLQGLSALGAGAGVLGTLLITLPAVSLPSMVMVRRALSWRVTAATGAAVAVTGLAGGALLWALA